MCDNALTYLLLIIPEDNSSHDSIYGEKKWKEKYKWLAYNCVERPS